MTYVPFHEATPETYEALGMRSGLEIHQQLLTEKKLFCRCPAGRYSSHWDAEILRHMRPTLSEMGEYDGTALMEFKTRKEIIYRINKDTVCTYEFDDTPPFMINPQALDIALGVTMLLKCKLISEVHIARKQYLDGSIPTGFQRTTILGVDGKIPYKGREIGIRQLGLEEDACREQSDKGHYRVYLTDRLGMPLIETVTEPHMRTPREVAEVGQILRFLARATGQVRTGIGAGREDVNVSIEGGTRVEIKGVPRIPRIPLLVHNEAFRQRALLDIRDDLIKKGVTPETFESQTTDVTTLLKDTRFTPIRLAQSEGHQVLAVILRGFKGMLGRKTQPGTRFLREFSDRVRVIACLDLLPNIVCSDLAEGNLTPTEWRSIRKAVQCGGADAIVLVWGTPCDVALGAKEIVLRAREALTGIPSETRQALHDDTNGFERILPGPDRMYPDTDLPPLAIDVARLERVRAGLPPAPWERHARYLELGLSQEVARTLSISTKAPLFDEAIERGCDVGFAARLLVQELRGLRRRGCDPTAVAPGFLFGILEGHRDGRIFREAAPLLLEAGTSGTELEAAVAELGLSPATPAEQETSISTALKTLAEVEFADTGARDRALMGHAMASLRGRVDGSRIRRRIHEKLDTTPQANQA